jgi:flagellar biosynthesis protein FlhA
MPRFLLALNTGGVVQEIDGMDTIDPSFGMPAKWIASTRRQEARRTATWSSSRRR